MRLHELLKRGKRAVELDVKRNRVAEAIYSGIRDEELVERIG